MSVNLPPTMEQGQALDRMDDFLHDPMQRQFQLTGYAGTGKTFTIGKLTDQVGGRFIFTAPTNKATKVLRDTMTTDHYKPETRTIYSLLGLSLGYNGEVKELSVPEDQVDLSAYWAVIVDESSMINSTLYRIIKSVADEQNVKFIRMGDPCQLNPVGEVISPVWKDYDAMAELTTVMRNAGPILELATSIRQQIGHPAPQFRRKTNIGEASGVYDCTEGDFQRRILNAAECQAFSKVNESKVIAWRNITVDAHNKRIRRVLFGGAADTFFLVDDRVIFTEPAKDLTDKIVATTDDEGRVTAVEVEQHPQYQEFTVWRLSITLDTNDVVVARVLHESSTQAFMRKKEEMIQAAKLDRRKWPLFYKFMEAFHQVRHAYAITAHRSQGSTYASAFVDWHDILINRERQEAFRALYVACSRPKKELFLG